MGNITSRELRAAMLAAFQDMKDSSWKRTQPDGKEFKNIKGAVDVELGLRTEPYLFTAA